MIDFEPPILLGLIFDLAPQHQSADTPLNLVKTSLVEYLVAKGLTGRIYVYHPDWLSIPLDQGQSTYFVASYQESPRFRIDFALRETVTLIGDRNENCVKYVILVTDRFQAPNNIRYRKGFLTNEMRGYDCKFLIYGIGDAYDKITLKSIAEEYGASYKHLDNPSLLGKELLQIGN